MPVTIKQADFGTRATISGKNEPISNKKKAPAQDYHTDVPTIYASEHGFYPVDIQTEALQQWIQRYPLKVYRLNLPSLPAGVQTVHLHALAVPLHVLTVGFHALTVPMQMQTVAMYLQTVPLHMQMVAMHMLTVGLHALTVPLHMQIGALVLANGSLVRANDALANANGGHARANSAPTCPAPPGASGPEKFLNEIVRDSPTNGTPRSGVLRIPRGNPY